MTVVRADLRLKLKFITTELLIFNLFPIISTEITFAADEAVTLVPYPFSAKSIVTVLPEVERFTTLPPMTTIMANPPNFGEKGVRLTKLSQERLDAEIRKRLNIPYTTIRLNDIKHGHFLQRVGGGKPSGVRKNKKRYKGRPTKSSVRQKEYGSTATDENNSESRNYNYDPAYYGSQPSSSNEDNGFTTSYGGEKDVYNGFITNYGGEKDVYSGFNGYPSRDPSQFPALTTTFAPKIIPRPLQPDFSIDDWHMNSPQFRNPAELNDLPMYVDYADGTPVVKLGKYWDSHGPHAHYHVKTTVKDVDHDEDHDHGFDSSKFIMLLLLKLGLGKLKFFLFFKFVLFFLIKMKFLLTLFFLKLLVLMFKLKLFKMALIPMHMMLIGPILHLISSIITGLLPMLMPLLRLLGRIIRVPVLVPPGGAAMGMKQQKTDEGTEVDGEERNGPQTFSNPSISQYEKILRSDQCVMNYLCQVANFNKRSFVVFLIFRALKYLSTRVPQEVLKPYFEAYESGLSLKGNESSCATLYYCQFFENQTSQP